MAPCMNDQAVMCKRLQDQQFSIPDLRSFFTYWSETINPRHEELRALLNIYIDSLYPDNPKKTQKIKATRLDQLACLWWPNTRFEDLCTLSRLMVWLLLWDDEMDQAAGVEEEEITASQLFREYTLFYVAHSLELPSHVYPGAQSLKRYHFVERFRPIADAIRGRYDLDQRVLFFREIEFTVAMSEPSNWFTSTTVYPRLGLSGQSPRGLREHPLMLELCFETNLTIALINDILSLKKEVKSGEVCSLIPLLVNSGSTLQAAGDRMVLGLQACVIRMEQLYWELGLQFESTTALEFAHVCYTYCAGFLHWRLATRVSD
ncbi:isoprenoid synthase domain-containing protein [Aspergillus avenaceus]|uniref:Isoprenoid synthase domain-containing protein n=1 Tax=Aspergillus avenaceus TaxID=36643 RepID=A0A5N6U7N2_ASPAV|nr:isoprenoid synthase domain-containing protein [Aspergillus avenaceus]